MNENLSRFRSVLVVVLVLALLACVPWAAGRLALEAASRRVELTIDLQEFAVMAVQQGLDLPHLLDELRDAGVTSAGVSEATVAALADRGEVTLLDGAEVMALAAAGANLPPGLREAMTVGTVRPGQSYVIAKDAATATDIEKGLKLHLPPDTVSRISPTMIWVKVNPAVVYTTPAVMPVGDILLATQAGLGVVPRWSDVTNPTPQYLQRLFDALPAGARVPFALPLGTAVPGYPGEESTFASLLAKHGIMWGLVETQAGALAGLSGRDDLVKLAGPNVVRAWSTTVDLTQLQNVQPDFLARQAAAAAADRNVRVIYLHPILAAPPGKTVEGINLEFVRDIVTDLHRAGLSAGPVRPYYPAAVPLPVRVAVMVAVAAAWLWLWTLWPRSVNPLPWMVAKWTAAAFVLAGLVVIVWRPLWAERVSTLAVILIAPVMVAALSAWRYGGASRNGPGTYWVVLADGLVAMIYTALAVGAGGLAMAVLTLAPGYRAGILGLRQAGLWGLVAVAAALLVYLAIARRLLPNDEAPADPTAVLLAPLRLGDAFVALVVLIIAVLPFLASFPVPGAGIVARLVSAGMPSPLQYLVAWPLVVAGPALWRSGRRRWLWAVAVATAYLVAWPLSSLASGTSALETLLVFARGFWAGAVLGGLGLMLIWRMDIRRAAT